MVEYWWIPFVTGLFLIIYAIVSQVRWMKKFANSNNVDDAMNNFFRGVGLRFAAAFVGGFGILLGLIGLVASLFKG